MSTTTDASAGPATFLERLRAFEGRSGGPTVLARDPVNQPMIRHWCDAMGDTNPVYTDPESAAASIHGGIIAPPTMLQAWTMPGLGDRIATDDAEDHAAALRALLEDAGFTSVVATDCEQEYRRELRPGDHLSVSATIESVSEQKATSLGDGHFVTSRQTYTDQDGQVVATMRFRILKFRPPSKDA